MKREYSDSIRGLFADNLRKYRNAMGYSQEKFSRHVDIAVSMIAAIETGTKFPSSKSIEKICKALNVDAYQLFLPPRLADNSDLKRFSDISRLRQRVTESIVKAAESEFNDYLN